ncbi:MAG TPA: 4Fe-4S binding protein, partial [Nannocystis exedens]|nr:4Fe-4S binding protein [Nannocystis exedens]
MVAQGLRHLLQLSVLVFVVYAAMGGIWRNYKVAHNNARLVELMEGERWATAYSLNEDALTLLGEPYEASLNFLGMPWSGTVGGVETLDPILALSLVVSTGSITLDLVLGSLVAVVLALLLGKVFCSHLCPMRLLFEIGQLIRGGLLWLGAPLPHLRPTARLG